MLSQQSQMMDNATPNPPNNNSDPLNDHDYCSPNKMLAPKSLPPSNNSNSDDKKDDSTRQATLNTVADPETNNSTVKDSVAASTSLSPDAQQNIDQCDKQTLSLPKQSSDNNDHLDDSASSSSLSSSADLVIAQDSQKIASLQAKSSDVTPTPKRKPGRPRVNKDASKNSPQVVSTKRSSRPRQNTSVTDKSEWITGEEQIDSILSEQLNEEPREKRHKPKELDSAFEQFSSSDYSSSDAESDEDSDDNSEDDPNRLWCVCQKPHEGKFMICCDICKDWFHGHCVGVTKLMGDRFEKQGKEWFCGECQEKLRAGIPRNAIPTKIVKKEKKAKKSSSGKRGRGRPRKSESLSKDQPTRASSRTTRKSSSSLDPKFGVDNLKLRKNLARAEARSESFDSSFEDSQRLKELIKERKKSFFLKRRLAEQQRAAKRTEMGFGRQSLTASLSDSLDSLATSTNTPNMNNLPINIKSEHKERQKPNIVLQINTKKDGSMDNGDSRIVTTIVRSTKKSRHAESNESTANDTLTTDSTHTNKKVKIQADTSPQTTSHKIVGASVSPNGDSGRKRSTSSSAGAPKPSKQGSAETGEHVTPKKKRKDSESSPTNGSSNQLNSKHISQKIKESLESRYDQMKDLEVQRDTIEKLASDIEVELSQCFKEPSKYMSKFRSLLFNLRDQKNQGLVRNVLSGEIEPARLVRMSPDEMASHELAKWRERENKHSIELIKRDAEMIAQQVIVKKTHKGEEVIPAPLTNKPDDPTATTDNQEPPTTPTKPSAKDIRVEGSKTTPPPATAAVSSGPLKMRITGAGPDSTSKSLSQDREAASSSPKVESIAFLDTTKEHKSHVYDMNCKICTKEMVEEPDRSTPAAKQNESERKSSEATPSTSGDQPKRIRVSMETKLDPANLSRFREQPIIQPSQVEPDDSNCDAEASPNAVTSSRDGPDADDDDEYDPSNYQLEQKSLTPEQLGIVPSSSNEPCWSGTINMPDIAKFSASARAVSGVVDFMHDEIDQNLLVCGRIAPDQVQGYIKKLRDLKGANKSQILVIQLQPKNTEDKANFESFFDYLYSRNRYGVIQAAALKDFYIIPIHQKGNIPDIVKPIQGPGIDTREQNTLLGLLVRSKKHSSYTPAPL